MFTGLQAKFPVQFSGMLQSLFIRLETQSGPMEVQLRNILYCTSDGSATTFCIRGSKPVIVREPLKNFNHILRNYGFARATRNQLVNLVQVSACSISKNGFELLLTNGDRIYAEAALKKEVDQAIKRFSEKEKTRLVQVEWQLMNHDFIHTGFPRTSDFTFRYSSPQ